MPGYPPSCRLCSSIAIKPYRLVSYWCVCALIASACPPLQYLYACPRPAGRARSCFGDGWLENTHLVPAPYRRCWAASSGGTRAPGDWHHPPRGPYLRPLPPGAGFGTMRGCGARLVWLLVLSLVWLGPALGGEEEDGEGVVEEEEKEEVVSDELKEEDGVLVLHEHNFARALSEHRLLLVEFCKCPHRGQGCGQGRVWGVGVGREYGQGVQARGTGVGRSRRMRTGPGMGGEGVWARGKAAGQRVRATGHGL